MTQIFKAALNSGISVGVLGGVFLGVNEILFHDSGLLSLLAFPVGGGLFFILGSILAFLLLLPLKPIFIYFKPFFSFITFVAVGAGIPFWIDHSINKIHAHGIDPYSEGNLLQTVIIVAIHCFLGAVGAVSAWITLRKIDARSDN
ncbi:MULTISPECIES: hypothetical protein [unclassified Microbulbifer]|uniref:hypothetical protein n=1 Tax=unclassified Microbulbifer TaxID=2619833 RepID=UPI0027E4FF38|nr:MULTISPECIES: hypothetical protein [unclassified Microbulbifer]